MLFPQIRARPSKNDLRPPLLDGLLMGIHGLPPAFPLQPALIFHDPL